MTQHILVLLNNQVLAEYSTETEVIKNKHAVSKNSRYKVVHIISEAAEILWNVNVAEQAHYEHWLINLSLDKVQYQLNLDLQGPGAKGKIRGILLGNARANLQHQVRVNHLADDSSVDIVVHSIADGQSKVAFDGAIHVAKHIKGVDAHELLKSLVLSNRAEIDVKPILEIYSNDIRCSHGASIGDLDSAALFYLQSRGFSSQEAKAILLKAFATAFLDELNNEGLQAQIEQLILAHIEQQGKL